MDEAFVVSMSGQAWDEYHRQRAAELELQRKYCADKPNNSIAEARAHWAAIPDVMRDQLVREHLELKNKNEDGVN